MTTSLTQEGGDESRDATYTLWIDVQKKTFTNWVNDKLKGTQYKVEVLENDLDDGVTLIKLLETLANKQMHKRYNPKPRHLIHKRENIEIALEFLTKVENIKIENIGVSDITGHNLTLILALVWALILHYQMAKQQYHTGERKMEETKRDVTADELLLGWIRIILPGNNIDNLTSAWNDGRNLSALVNYCEPGLIPHHASLDPKNRLENIRQVMTLAEQHLNIPQVMHPEDLAVDHPDKLSTMTYLSQFWWRSRHQPTSPQQGERCGSKPSSDTQADLEMRLYAKEEELQLLKQQAEKEKQQAEWEKEELQIKLDLVTKESKEQLESLRRELNQTVLTIQEEHRMQLEQERMSKERELLKRDTEHKKQLEAVQMELQRVKQTMQNNEEDHKRKLSNETKVLQKELEFEKLLKGHELWKREKEITEHKKQLESVRNQLERDKRKLSAVQEEEMRENDSQSPEVLSLHPLSCVSVSSADSLKKLANSKSKFQTELASQVSQLFKKSQVQLQPQVFLILPSASSKSGRIVHVTPENAEQNMAQWEESAAFTFQDVFQQWSDHIRRNEPILGTKSLKELVETLEEVVEWFQFGIHLEIPHYELSIIKADHQDVRKCKTEMFQWWLKNSPEAKWSNIVKALVKTRMKALAHKIALDHGVPTACFTNVSEAATTGEPSPHMADEWKKELKQLRDIITAKDQELAKKEEDLQVSQQKRETLTHEMGVIREKIKRAQKRLQAILHEKDALERDLKLKEVEIEVLQLKNSSIIGAKQQLAYYQKQLEFIRQELEAEKIKIFPLQDELHRKRVEVAEKMKDIQYLTEARDRANSELGREREKAEQKSKELTAAAISHAARSAEFQLQLASLRESKAKNDQVIETLQKTIEWKNTVIQNLSQQIALKEDQMKQWANTLDAVKLEHILELEDMKMKVIELEHERDCAHTAAKCAQEDACIYAEALLRATKLTLKWSNRKRAPKRMYRGAAVVQGTTAFIIGAGSHTIYSYRLDRDKWNKHSESPHVYPGLVFINDLLTAIGGEEGDCFTNKLVSWNRTKWVEQFPPMLTPRENPAVVCHGNYVIAIGGDYEEGGVELLHIPSLIWSTVTSLPSPLRHITATLCHDDIVAMDLDGYAYSVNIGSLISSIGLEEPSTEQSQWVLLPKCPVQYDMFSGASPSLTTFHGHFLVVSHSGVFQLQERRWVRIGDMPAPMYNCIVCIVCDQMVVVGGHYPDSFAFTDAVRVAVAV